MIGVKKEQRNGQIAGFSLMEVMVSVTLFVVIMLSATQIFKMVLDSQRGAIATQNVQESLKYFLEVTAKEMRMAQKDEGICGTVLDDKIFAVSTAALGQTLNFKNRYGECVTYYLEADGDNQRFMVERNGEADYISPSSIKIVSLDFNLNETDNNQAIVTLVFDAYALNEKREHSEMTIQTSITSRYYK